MTRVHGRSLVVVEATNERGQRKRKGHHYIGSFENRLWIGFEGFPLKTLEEKVFFQTKEEERKKTDTSVVRV